MARFAVLTLLGLSTLCAIGSVDQVSAQSAPAIDVNALVGVLNQIASSGGGGGGGGEGGGGGGGGGGSESSGRPSLLNIDLLVQLLNGLLAGGNSGTVSTPTLTDMCNRACIRPPPSSGNNTDSLIAIRILIQLLMTIVNNSRATTGGDGSLLNVNVIISLLNAIAGKGTRSGGGTTRPLIGIDVLLEALNFYRNSRNNGGSRDCHIGLLNQHLQSEANNVGDNSGTGSVLSAANILPILNRVTYPPSRYSATNNNLIRVNVLIDALNQLLGGAGGGGGINTDKDALVSVDVGASLLNSCSKTGQGLVGLVLNLVRNLLGGLLGGQGGLLGGLLGGQGGLLGGVLGGKGGLGGVLSGLLGGLLG